VKQMTGQINEKEFEEEFEDTEFDAEMLEIADLADQVLEGVKNCDDMATLRNLENSQ